MLLLDDVQANTACWWHDMDNSYLALESRDESGLEDVLDSSVAYRIAMDSQQGRKAFTLQTLPPQGSLEERSVRVAYASL